MNKVPRKSRQANYKRLSAFHRSTCAAFAFDARGILWIQTDNGIDGGRNNEVAKAKALYPVARTYWERIEAVAEVFGDLDPRIDGREGDQAEGEDFTGGVEPLPGGVILDIPPLVENGNAVPVAIEVASPMTEARMATEKPTISDTRAPNMTRE